jgi:hypothetical protein
MFLKNNKLETLTYNKLEDIPPIEKNEIWKKIDLNSLWEKTERQYETLEEYIIENKT